MPIPLGILAVAGASGGGGLTNDYVRLESTILTNNATSVTFSNLSNYSSYRHLQVRYVAKSAGTNSGRQILMRLNGVTSASYADHRLRGDGSNVASAGNPSIDFMLCGIIAGSPSGMANSFGVGVVDFLDAFSASKNKVFRCLYGHSTSPANQVGLTSGLLVNTNALSSIQFYVEANENLTAGSRFSLYGIR